MDYAGSPLPSFFCAFSLSPAHPREKNPSFLLQLINSSHPFSSIIHFCPSYRTLIPLCCILSLWSLFLIIRCLYNWSLIVILHPFADFPLTFHNFPSQTLSFSPITLSTNDKFCRQKITDKLPCYTSLISPIVLFIYALLPQIRPTISNFGPINFTFHPLFVSVFILFGWILIILHDCSPGCQNMCTITKWKFLHS